MTHAPTPWKQHQTNGQTYASVKSANNDTVADCGSRSDPRAQANAEFIVRAVNAHAALVFACQEMQKELKELCSLQGRKWDETDSLDLAASALRLAKGEKAV